MAAVKFFDIASRSPKGGWRAIIGGIEFDGSDESGIALKVSQWRRNNGTFTTEADITEELWRYWCDREPDRCRASGGTPQEMPSTLQKAVNVTGAIARTVVAAVTGQPVTANPTLQEDRLTICRDCKHYDPHTGACYKCGCPTKAKAALAQETCPIGKW